MTVLVSVFECLSCGRRYPLMPYYPHAAPHGPDRDCRAELGWLLVKEEFPPTKKNDGP